MADPIELVLVGAVVVTVAWLIRHVARHLDRHDRALDERQSQLELAEERTRAALGVEGALPTDPIVVASAAAIEPRAEAEACRICGGGTHVLEHATSAGRLRHVTLRCGSCGRETELFFRIEADAPS